MESMIDTLLRQDGRSKEDGEEEEEEERCQGGKGIVVVFRSLQDT